MEITYPAELGDGKFFRQYLLRRMVLLGLTDEDCSKIIDCSISSIRCWKNGIAVPHLVVQKLVYRELEKKLGESEES